MMHFVLVTGELCTTAKGKEDSKDMCAMTLCTYVCITLSMLTFMANLTMPATTMEVMAKCLFPVPLN